MYKLIRKLTLPLATLALVFSFSSVALAAEGDPPTTPPSQSAKEAICEGVGLTGDTDGCEDAESGVQGIVATVINILSILAGIIAVIVIIVNGLRFVVSNGDSNAVSGARQGIIYAIVGLIVVLMAQIIVRFVLNRAA